jgi:hypothetical protein
MEEIRIYRQSSLYTASAWLLVFGRIGVVAMLPVFALLFWSPRDGRFVHPPGWWVVLIACVGAGTFAAISTGLALAVLMKCEQCGRRPTIVWNLKAMRAVPRSEWQALRDHFYPLELRSGNFQCAHCKTRFRLRAART